MANAMLANFAFLSANLSRPDRVLTRPPDQDDHPVIFLPAVFLFCLIFHLLTPLYTTPKQISWILTTLASAIMTLVSIPFVWDYVRSGGDVKSVRTLPMLTYTTSRIFQAYLVSDLMMGVVYYRSQVTLLTGWIHHTLYVFIVHLAIKREWTQMFCMCAFMELPTFLLAISSLNPRFRSNVAFAVAFFVTRIVMHLVWCISYALPANRARTSGGSIIPSVMLACVFPLHALWFKACVQGFLKRYNANHAGTAQVVTADSTQFTGNRGRTSSAPYLFSRRAWQNHPARALARQHWARRRNRFWSVYKVVYEFVGLSPRDALPSGEIS